MTLIDKYNKAKAEYNHKTNINYRKDNGQIFTPIYVADLMTEWVLRAEGIMSGGEAKILDPALGLGVFFQSFIRINNRIEYLSQEDVKVYGIEKDHNLLKECDKLYNAYENIFLLRGDYLLNWNTKFDSDNHYDGIICNPPYLIYKKYNNNKYLSLFKEKMNLSLSGFTNLCMLFILKSLSELKKGGRMAYIVPSEFMNADYGKAIKKTIIDYGFLRHVIILNYNLFTVNTTSSILLFANDDDSNGEVKFFNINNKEELLSLFYKEFFNNCIVNFKNSKKRYEIERYEVKKYDEKREDNSDCNDNLDNKILSGNNSSVFNNKLDYKKKWRHYYQNINSSEYQNLVKLSEYAKVLRGIATGANDFFLFNESKKKKYGIDSKYLLPCISRSSYIDSQYINSNNFSQLRDEGKKVFLLDAANKKQNLSLKKYIKYGEEKDYNQRYLTRNRSPWYKLEDKPPAPILAKVFNRKGLEFVINEAKLYNLTAYHGIYIKSEQYSKLLKAYLLTDIAHKIIEDNRREYGDGLNKFEPNDLNNSLVLDLKIINKTDQEEISYLFDRYCKKINSANSFNGETISDKEDSDKEGKNKGVKDKGVEDKEEQKEEEDIFRSDKKLSRIFLKYLKE